MPTTEIQEIIRKCLSSWSNLDLQYSSEYDKVEKEMTEALNEAYTLGHRAAIEEVEKKIEDKCPKKFAIHDDEEGKRIQADYETGFKDAKKSIMYSISSLKESDNGSAQEK